jgi:hypothetical protein
LAPFANRDWPTCGGLDRAGGHLLSEYSAPSAGRSGQIDFVGANGPRPESAGKIAPKAAQEPPCAVGSLRASRTAPAEAILSWCSSPRSPSCPLRIPHAKVFTNDRYTMFASRPPCQCIFLPDGAAAGRVRKPLPSSRTRTTLCVYNGGAWSEDRATLESDLSAEPGEVRCREPDPQTVRQPNPHCKHFRDRVKLKTSHIATRSDPCG